jgi:hypothetical protein
MSLFRKAVISPTNKQQQHAPPQRRVNRYEEDDMSMENGTLYTSEATDSEPTRIVSHAASRPIINERPDSSFSMHPATLEVDDIDARIVGYRAAVRAQRQQQEQETLRIVSSAASRRQTVTPIRSVQKFDPLLETPTTTSDYTKDPLPPRQSSSANRRAAKQRAVRSKALSLASDVPLVPTLPNTIINNNHSVPTPYHRRVAQESAVVSDEDDDDDEEAYDMERYKLGGITKITDKEGYKRGDCSKTTEKKGYKLGDCTKTPNKERDILGDYTINTKEDKQVLQIETVLQDDSVRSDTKFSNAVVLSFHHRDQTTTTSHETCSLTDMSYDSALDVLVSNINVSDKELMERSESPGCLRLTEQGLREHDEKTAHQSRRHKSSQQGRSGSEAPVKDDISGDHCITNQRRKGFRLFRSRQQQQQMKNDVPAVNTKQNNAPSMNQLTPREKQRIDAKKREFLEAERLKEATPVIKLEPLASTTVNLKSSLPTTDTLTPRPSVNLRTLPPCVVCAKGERTHIAMPCMHYSFCQGCVRALTELEPVACPVCMEPNVQFKSVSV